MASRGIHFLSAVCGMFGVGLYFVLSYVHLAGTVCLSDVHGPGF